MPPKKTKRMPEGMGLIDWKKYEGFRTGFRTATTGDRQTVAARLLSQIEGYEGDFVLHVLNDSQLVLAVRDADKQIVIYDCTIERQGIGKEQPRKEDPEAQEKRAPMQRKPKNTLF